MPIFSKNEKEQVELAIAAAEKHTSGQLVVKLVAKSARYRRARLQWAIFGAIASTLISWLILGWHLSAEIVVLVQIFGSLSLWALSAWPPVLRLMLSKNQMAWHVHREAMVSFLLAGIQNTQSRTGVLVFISLLEHRVEILADRAINEKCPPGYWNEQVNHIIEGIHQKKASESLKTAITEIGRKLAEHFPPTAEGKNELPNQIL